MKDSTIYILGHKNPDTDSICSAIAYSELKRELGYKKVTAGRVGNINQETKYVLDYFDLPVPKLIEHMRTQVIDVDYYDTLPIYPDISMGEAWKIMLDTRRRMLPVIDRESQKLIGVITLGDISRINMKLETVNSISQYNPSIKNMYTTFNARVISGDLNQYENTLIKDNIFVVLSASEILSQTIKENDVIITRSSRNCINAALSTESKYIFLINGSQEYREYDFSNAPKDKIIFFTEHDVYSTIKLLNYIIPVFSIMSKNDLAYFNGSDFLSDVKRAMLESRFRNFAVLSDDEKVLGTLTRRHAIEKNRKKVILVDHNEWTQTVTGLDEAEVLEIVDHHRVGDVQTGGPILFRNEPLGSTCTIISKLYRENDIAPTKKMAGVMLSGIISDTLLFKSPTCTETDINIAKKLADIAEIDLESFGTEILRAGASIKGKTIKEIINNDFKEYQISNIKLFIGQAFITDLNEVRSIKNEIVDYINILCRNNEYDLGGLIVTEIFGKGSEFIFSGNSKEIVEKAFNLNRNTDIVFLPNVVSRKKQIVPLLAEYI